MKIPDEDIVCLPALGRRCIRLVLRDYKEAVNKIVPHRVLAINRGESESVLKVNIDVDAENMHRIIKDIYLKHEPV